MKRIVYAVLATVAGLVLLFSYRTSLEGEAAPLAGGTGTTTSGATGSTGSGSAGSSSGSGSAGSSSSGSSSSGSSSSGSSGSSSSGSSGSASSSSTLKDGTFTGRAADTRYGPVQVRITVSGGRITNVSVPQYPNTERRDQQINAYAVPQLISETISAQSAKVDMISGATFTSDGYQQSLQSALDQAKA